MFRDRLYLVHHSKLAALRYLAPHLGHRLPSPPEAARGDDVPVLELLRSTAPALTAHHLKCSLQAALEHGGLRAARYLLERHRSAGLPLERSVLPADLDRMLRHGHVACARALLAANGGTFPSQADPYIGDGSLGVEGVRMFEGESLGGPWAHAGGTYITNLQALMRAAAARGDRRVLQVLLDAGGDDAGERGRALRSTVEARSVRCLEMLLLADPAPTAERRGMALCAAAGAGHLASVRLLLRPDTVRAVNPSAPPRTASTPLTLAVQGGHPVCVRLIARELGADLDAVDPCSGRTALQTALDHGSRRCARALERAGATR